METKKFKPLLYIGIALLIAGIFIKKLTPLYTVGLISIFIGVSLKVVYIYIMIKKNLYRPGKEAFLLLIGLLLFFSGLYLRNTEDPFIDPTYLIISGILLKILFIIGFIKAVRSQN